jgi:imidazole glycerol-phosphate synthase subunit HisF
MLKIRIIPSLLYNGSNLVKGKQFNSWRTVGTVFQSIKLYSLRGVDELIFLDITAYKNKKIDFNLIDDFADECFMPLTVGGGIRSIEDIEEALRNGADKVSINSAALENYQFIENAVKYFGSQCIILSIDYKKDENGNKKIYSNSKKKITKIDLFEYIESIEKTKPGEILLTSVDHDGMMNGFDIETIKKINKLSNIPIIASGGAGTCEDIYKVIKETNVQAIAASSIFHFTEFTPLHVKKYLRSKGLKVRKN